MHHPTSDHPTTTPEELFNSSPHISDYEEEESINNNAQGDGGWAITQRGKINLETQPPHFKSKQALESALRKQNQLIDQSTLLEQKKLELKEVQTHLDIKRQQYQALESKWKEREEVLSKKREQFLRRIADMQIFTKKTMRKIDKYQQKAEEERKQNLHKKKAIQQLESKIAELEHTKVKKDEYLKKIEPYQEFLNNVVSVEPTFQEVHKILQRHRTLVRASEQLQQASENYKTEQKFLQNEIKRISKDGQDQIHQLIAKLSKKQQQLEDQRSRLKHEESILHMQQNMATKTNQSLGQIKMSINNIFDRCSHSRKNKITGGTTKKSSDMTKKLEYIKKRIEDITAICHEIDDRVGDSGVEIS